MTDTTLTIKTAEAGQVLVTLHLPLGDGQEIRASFLQPRRPVTIQQIQLELHQQVRRALASIDQDLHTP